MKSLIDKETQHKIVIISDRSSWEPMLQQICGGADRVPASYGGTAVIPDGYNFDHEHWRTIPRRAPLMPSEVAAAAAATAASEEVRPRASVSLVRGPARVRSREVASLE